jgi:periplasmic divalent cation tolerance protein
MRSGSTAVLVLVTAPDLGVARRLARRALRARLAACVNLLPRLESHYWWRGRIEAGAEVLLLIKSSRARLAALEACVLEAHPYDTPEFLVVSIRGSNARYLGWLLEACRQVRPRTSRSGTRRRRAAL